MSLLLKTWRGLMSVSEPVRSRHLRRRVAKGKEDPARLCERYGKATVPRPEGKLLWIHAASNGEALASLPLVEALRVETPGLAVLITTFTVTGAELIRKQAPDIIHQFKPSEDSGAINAFLDHWKPDLALFIESEFWPNLMWQVGQRGIPMAQVNGHLSEGSARFWRIGKRSFVQLMASLSARLVKTESVKARMVGLGVPADTIAVTGDLKASRGIQYPNATLVHALRSQIGARPVFLAASTHKGEEEAVGAAHEALSKRAPNFLTIIAPRHVTRGDEIETMLAVRGLTVHRRSKNETPDDAAVYLADTTGEMPLWYALAPITFIGAGWGEGGGHNPLEAAQAGCAVLSGPKVHASQDAFDRLDQAGAMRFVDDEADLIDAVLALTDDAGRPNETALAMGEAGKTAAAPDPSPLANTMKQLRPLTERAFH